jgi:hypothetical protein
MPGNTEDMVSVRYMVDDVQAAIGRARTIAAIRADAGPSGPP